MEQKFEPHTWKFKILIWRKGWICKFLHKTCTSTLRQACMSPWRLHICISLLKACRGVKQFHGLCSEAWSVKNTDQRWGIMVKLQSLFYSKLP